MKGENMAKRSSFGSIVRKRFSDITNSQPQSKFYAQEECQMPISPSTKDCIDKLIKENTTLVRLIEDRNKLIELSGAEIQKLKIFSQKMQLQNWNLAQSNSHMLAEVNVGKEKLKGLQHEIVCKDAVLKAKKLALEGKENILGQNTRSQDEDNDVEKCLPKVNNENDNQTGIANRRQAARSRSMGPSTTFQHAAEKETVENKRRCLRRQSARFKSQHSETKENLFEIEDSTKFPDNRDSLRHGDSSRRSSTGRPSRRAVEKVQSYKEVPCNIKMRRTE